MKFVSSILASAGCALLLSASLFGASTTAANQDRGKSWPAETLAGTITMVTPTEHLMVIRTPDGTPYDLVVTPGTSIHSGNQRVMLRNLNQDVNRHVSVRFTPEGRGDVASSIQING